jgi:putative pyruvate formate lyase activating enzyme
MSHKVHTLSQSQVHLVLPVVTAHVAEFLARELSPDTYVNLMVQYHPSGKVNSETFSEINRRITQAEYGEATNVARSAGLYRFDQ